jgi:hypothetical protein
MKQVTLQSIALRALWSFVAMTLFASSIGVSFARAENVPSVVLPSRIAGDAAVMLKGLKIDPNDPMHFEFIVDTADKKISDTDLKNASSKLIRYFLACLALPEKDLWVNLSPTESNRIIPDELARTELGEGLLAQDYVLKQLAASLTNPETKTGKVYWNSVGAQHAVPATEVAPDLSKIWIVPSDAEIFADGDKAFVTSVTLKVKSDASLRLRSGTEDFLSAIERDVNTRKDFAELRQMCNALMLSAWFKLRLRESVVGAIHESPLLGYVDEKRVRGVDLAAPDMKERIYAQYLSAFKKGAYDILKKERDPNTNRVVKRHYFSGGFSGVGASAIVEKKTRVLHEKTQSTISSTISENVRKVSVRMTELSSSGIDDLLAGIENQVKGFSSEQMRNIFFGSTTLQPFEWMGVSVKGLEALSWYRRNLENRWGQSAFDAYYDRGDYFKYLLETLRQAGVAESLVSAVDAVRMESLTDEVWRKRELVDRVVDSLEAAMNKRRIALGEMIPIVKDNYQAELNVVGTAPSFLVRNVHGDGYAEFSLLTLIDGFSDESMRYSGYERHSVGNDDEYVFTYHFDKENSPWSGLSAHVIFTEKGVEYYVRLFPRVSGERIGRINFMSGSKTRVKDMFRPQPNLGNMRYFPSDKSSVLLSVKETHEFNEGAAWMYAPPPLAVGLRLREDRQEWLMTGLVVQRDHYNFNSLDYYGDDKN